MLCFVLHVCVSLSDWTHTVCEELPLTQKVIAGSVKWEKHGHLWVSASIWEQPEGSKAAEWFCDAALGQFDRGFKGAQASPIISYQVNREAVGRTVEMS